MAVPQLETERLLLRQIEESDAEAFHAAYGDPEVMRYWDFAASQDAEQTAERIRHSRAVDPR